MSRKELKKIYNSDEDNYSLLALAGLPFGFAFLFDFSLCVVFDVEPCAAFDFALCVAFDVEPCVAFDFALCVAFDVELFVFLEDLFLLTSFVLPARISSSQALSFSVVQLSLRFFTSHLLGFPLLSISASLSVNHIFNLISSF